jgi:hypothetical protein
MTATLSSDCQPAECQATFTINGKRGDQRFSYGHIVTLQADDRAADTYLWESITSPPHCENLLTGITQSQARLALPMPGPYIVRLTLVKGDCTAQAQQTILVGVTDWLPYPWPYFHHPHEEHAGPAVRLVAAAIVDLGQRSETQGPGSLITLVASDPTQGLATLTFEGYDYSQGQKGIYVVNALPYYEGTGKQQGASDQPTQGQAPLVVVQFIQFSQEGFQLRMVDLAELPDGRPKLGPCMIEVCEIRPCAPQSSKTKHEE